MGADNLADCDDRRADAAYAERAAVRRPKALGYVPVDFQIRQPAPCPGLDFPHLVGPGHGRWAPIPAGVDRRVDLEQTPLLSRIWEA